MFPGARCFSSCVLPGLARSGLTFLGRCRWRGFGRGYWAAPSFSRGARASMGCRQCPQCARDREQPVVLRISKQLRQPGHVVSSSAAPAKPFVRSAPAFLEVFEPKHDKQPSPCRIHGPRLHLSRRWYSVTATLRLFPSADRKRICHSAAGSPIRLERGGAETAALPAPGE